MEKKENRKLLTNYVKSQCGTGFLSIKHCSKLSNSLVNNIIYNLNNIYTSKWKELNKIDKVKLFFEHIVDSSWSAITLRFSEDLVAKCIYNTKITDFIRRRLNENFKNRLGYVPEYLFSLEFDNKMFHIHGVIKPDNNFDLIKKILKTTAFSKKNRGFHYPEQFKLRCRMIYNPKGWGRYILKKSYHPKFDIYICNPITRQIAKKYCELLSSKNIHNAIRLTNCSKVD